MLDVQKLVTDFEALGGRFEVAGILQENARLEWHRPDCNAPTDAELRAHLRLLEKQIRAATFEIARFVVSRDVLKRWEPREGVRAQ